MEILVSVPEGNKMTEEIDQSLEAEEIKCFGNS